MYTDISKMYTSYVKFYCNIANKTDILAKGMQKISDDVRALRTSQILKHGEYFDELVALIFKQFQNADFCRQTRLFSNLIFMLFKDLIKVYKVYYVHITEILERFAQLNFEDGQKAFKMYQSFVNLTDSIKSKANKLIYSFNFPIQLPDFYNPEKGLVDTLRVVVESNEPANVAEVAKKVRGGMNRDQFQGAGGNSKPTSKDNTDNDDGEKEYYFDCTILDKLQGPGGEEIKADTGIDLMEFISKSDFSTVGGQNNRVNQPANTGFDFNDFNTGSSE